MTAYGQRPAAAATQPPGTGAHPADGVISTGPRPAQDTPARTEAAHPDTGPLCGGCEDGGVVDRCPPSTDAVNGSRPCPDEACRRRRAEHAARAARQHTEAVLVGDEEFAPQVCSQCARGGYAPLPGRYALGRPVYGCTAAGCGHTVDVSAFELGEGERLVVHGGRLCLARPHGGLPL
ncbi:hypothetical protein ABT269_39980 [Streptomyces viridosporus]|uniref:hypothetical protein n=1 Tax=Streptomyces viridosporus TaxID=67581 RepID=UPI0033217261